MARLVYSSGSGGRDRSPAGDGRAPLRMLAPASHSLRVRRERGGRKGKTVTIVAPLFLADDDARDLLKRLKKRCAGGGAIKRGNAPEEGLRFELQGDHADVVVEILNELGFPSKRAGG